MLSLTARGVTFSIQCVSPVALLLCLAEGVLPPHIIERFKQEGQHPRTARHSTGAELCVHTNLPSVGMAEPHLVHVELQVVLDAGHGFKREGTPESVYPYGAEPAQPLPSHRLDLPLHDETLDGC